MKYLSFIIIQTAFLFCCHAGYNKTIQSEKTKNEIKIINVQKIWDKAPHNAFTDLVFYKDKWWCVFREGENHVSSDGAIRIINSADAVSWESAALIKSPDEDLRDAKLVITPHGDFMLSGAGALHKPNPYTHQSYVWFSKDGINWSEKTAVADPNFWLWRITWHKKICYGIGYDCGGKNHIRLYKSYDGKKFDILVDNLKQDKLPNESSIIFNGDTALCFLRREEGNRLFGISKPPYKKWIWKDNGMCIGGPHMLQIPDGRIIAVVRLYDGKVRTSVCQLNQDTGELKELLKLPSGVDTSYAGLVWHKDLLYISYYSSHEGKPAIYFASVQI